MEIGDWGWGNINEESDNDENIALKNVIRYNNDNPEKKLYNK